MKNKTIKEQINVQNNQKSDKAKLIKSNGFNIRRDDSFPYAQKQNKYWSGYFTTRPQFKKLLRTTSARFHSSLS